MSLAQLLQHVQPAAAATAPRPIGTVGDVLQFGQDEAGHDQLAVEDFCLDHVGDSSVDHHARIQDKGLQPLHFLGKFHIGNNETKIVAGLHQQADAQVAQNDTQRQIDRGPIRLQNRMRRQRQPHDIGQEKADNRAEIHARDHVQLLVADKNIGRDHGHRHSHHPQKNRPGKPGLGILGKPIGPDHRAAQTDRHHDEYDPQQHERDAALARLA